MAGEITSESKRKDVVSDIVNAGNGYEAAAGQVESDTHLEDDTGTGAAAIIRKFEYAANPVAFKHYTPTKQELFNFHLKQIEMELWKDGMQIMPEVQPQLTINKKKTKYRIFVGAKPGRGQILLDKPMTLSEVVKK